MTVETRYPVLIFLFGLVFGSSVTATPLHEAVLSGDAARVQALITPNLKINERDSSGVAAIHLAVLESNIELIEILINNGADVNIAVNSSRTESRFHAHLHEFTPLHIAANFHFTANLNSFEMAGLLIANGADVNQKSDDGQSPLHIAVRGGNDRLVELLIANGADVNAKDFEDYTPLHNAAWNGRLGVVEVLVSNGADINASAYDGRTPYRCATRKNHQDVTAFFESEVLGSCKSHSRSCDTFDRRVVGQCTCQRNALAFGSTS